VFAGNAHSEYKEGTTLVDMLKEDLIAERIAIESYREMARFFEGKTAEEALNRRAAQKEVFWFEPRGD
jgi:bacterioferritin (cytochrome b1)